MTTASALFEAIKANDLNALRDMLAREPALAEARDERGVSALLVALYQRRDAMVELLRGARTRLDIYEAAALGRGTAVADWLDREPGLARSVSPDGFTPLHLAAFFGHAIVVRELLARGAPVNVAASNPMRVTPLHSAAAAHSAEIVHLLLEAGAEPDVRQEAGFTALHAAALHGDVEMARDLIAHGADPGLAADDGQTARDFGKESPALLELLVH